VTLSEITKEFIIVKQVSETMGIKLNLPILVKVENVDEIYSNNSHYLSQGKKPIDIQCHFVHFCLTTMMQTYIL
jgi:hypothetical protein